uniref:A kinase (PRKA) anchor protein 7 n=1 Tax=Cyprinus carpio TaxID=7962 RepID=A0A8C1NQC6_CYPCA
KLIKSDSNDIYNVTKDFCFEINAPAPDDEELVSLSKQLVEDAVLRAVQQYMEETQQNGAAPRDEAPPGATSKLNTTK